MSDPFTPTDEEDAVPPAERIPDPLLPPRLTENATGATIAYRDTWYATGGNTMTEERIPDPADDVPPIDDVPTDTSPGAEPVDLEVEDDDGELEGGGA